MMGQQWRQFCGRISDIHNFAWVGMKQGDRQIARDQPAGPIKDTAPLNRCGFAVLGNRQAGIVIGKANNPCADHADK